MALGVQISSFVLFGTPTLNATFGAYICPSSVQIQRIQISGQTGAAGGAITVTLVNQAGISYGRSAILPAGRSYYDNNLAAPLSLAPGYTIRAKITGVDNGTAANLVVNLIGATSQGISPFQSSIDSGTPGPVGPAGPAGVAGPAGSTGPMGPPGVLAASSPLVLDPSNSSIALDHEEPLRVVDGHLTVVGDALNTPSTLVQRNSLGQVVLGGLVVTNDIPSSTGGIAAEGSLCIGSMVFTADAGDIQNSGNLSTALNGTFGGNVQITGFLQAGDVVADDDLTVTDDAAIGGDLTLTGKIAQLQLGASTTNGRIFNWHFHPISQVLTGGAPTEAFNVNITGSAFGAKPSWGIVIPVNDNYTATYLVSSGSSTTTNAACEIRKIDGTNIPAGTFLLMGLFVELFH